METWRLPVISVILWISLIYHRLSLCTSLNEEGFALLSFKKKIEEDPYGALSKWDELDNNSCSWFGVKCSEDELVLALTLNDLSLKGTLTAELGKLIHVKSLILHNNSFYGSIPADIGSLQKLEVLDLGCNNFSGPVPTDLESIFSLELLTLEENRLLSDMSLEHSKLSLLSQIQADEEILSSSRRYISSNVESSSMRRLLQEKSQISIVELTPSPPSHPTPLAPSPDRPPSTFPSGGPDLLPPSPLSPDGSPTSPFGRQDTNPRTPTPEAPVSPSPALPPDLPPSSPPQPSPFPPHAPTPSNDSNPTASPPYHKSNTLIISVSVLAAVLFFIALSTLYVILFRPNKVVSPWRTGLSGQLSKAFITGVPSLRRAELETACENFSNIIGSLSSCLLYKGTLSNGEEIAVTSTMVKSAEEWSDKYELLFRNKISSFSQVNHKNFMNLLGYCEEEEPFTRMMVFEYAPNGTLFEHLHIKEAEHLDWAARKRIIMGIAYCLMHIEQLGHPITFRNLNSNSIYLTEDYAAKVSNIEFWDLEEVAKSPSENAAEQENIIYKFAILLLEVISGRLPFSEDEGLLALWASGYLDGKRPLKGMVDPTVESVSEEDISKLADVIRTCLAKQPEGTVVQQPTMAEVAERIRHITSLSPEHACPRLSPLWWAELEIISS